MESSYFKNCVITPYVFHAKLHKYLLSHIQTLLLIFCIFNQLYLANLFVKKNIYIYKLKKPSICFHVTYKKIKIVLKIYNLNNITLPLQI